MTRHRTYRWVSMLLVCILLCTGCTPDKAGGNTENPAEQEKNDNAGETAVEKEKVPDIGEVHLRDKDVLYENDDETSVVTMYLTVSRGNAAENTDHTWEEINTYSVYDYADMDVKRYQTAGLLQVGDENGPVSGEVGYGDTVPNATVQIRGQSSSRNEQKNYKIELKKNKGTWRGQRSIALNKHQTDGMRFRNKMAYNLIKGIPQMVGLRTQFVHLYVKDETDDTADGFQDYGLYTQVEQLNKTALKAHGMDSKGHLYKVNFFEFFRYEDIIKKEDDPTFNLADFEGLLEVKGNRDHTKLIEMLKAVNDISISVDTLVDQYFDRENLMYWMAFQILTGNVDTQSRNMYLYSPLSSDTWYILDWDNDGFFKNLEYEISKFVGKGSWESGISNYWSNLLFQRCLKSESFRQELDGVILEMKDYLSTERLSDMIESYTQVIKPYAFSMPDSMYIGVTSEEYDTIAQHIPQEVEENYKLYLESLEKPMPFYIGVPRIADGKLVLNWDTAYDLDAEDIVYTVELAKDYDFKDVLYRQENVRIPEAQTDLPAVGQYFVRVRATNASGKTQDSFDYYVTDSGKKFSMKCFYVQADETIGEDVYEE